MKDTLSNEHMSDIMPSQSPNSGCSVWFCSIHPFTPCLLETSWVPSSQMSSQDAFKFMLAFADGMHRIRHWFWFLPSSKESVIFLPWTPGYWSLGFSVVLESERLAAWDDERHWVKLSKGWLGVSQTLDPSTPIPPTLSCQQFLLSDPTESLVLIGPASLVSLPT